MKKLLLKLTILTLLLTSCGVSKKDERIPIDNKETVTIIDRNNNSINLSEEEANTLIEKFNDITNLEENELFSGNNSPIGVFDQIVVETKEKNITISILGPGIIKFNDIWYNVDCFDSFFDLHNDLLLKYDLNVIDWSKECDEIIIPIYGNNYIVNSNMMMNGVLTQIGYSEQLLENDMLIIDYLYSVNSNIKLYDLFSYDSLNMKIISCNDDNFGILLNY